MKHLLLRTLLTGDKLHIVHQKHVSEPVFFPKLLISALPNGLNELIGEGVPLDVENPKFRVRGVELVGDGVEQMGLAQSRLSVDKQGIVGLPWPVGHREGGGVGELVGGPHHEPLEGILLRTRHKGIPGALALLLQLALAQHDHLEVSGKELPQGLLNGGEVAGEDNIPLKVGGCVEHEAVFVQGDGACVVKPGVNGGGGHIPLHEREYLRPDIGWQIHTGAPLS